MPCLPLFPCWIRSLFPALVDFSFLRILCCYLLMHNLPPPSFFFFFAATRSSFPAACSFGVPLRSFTQVGAKFHPFPSPSFSPSLLSPAEGKVLLFIDNPRIFLNDAWVSLADFFSFPSDVWSVRWTGFPVWLLGSRYSLSASTVFLLF